MNIIEQEDKMIAFISSPYTHPDPKIQDERAKAAGDFAAYLWRERGAMVFSPIAHWHEIAMRNHLPGNAMAWAAYNREFVGIADVVYVLCISGWRDSQGIAMEVKWADDIGVPVFYASPLGGGFIYSEDPPHV